MHEVADDIDGYFPIFMMGNSLESFLKNRVFVQNNLMTPMPQLKNINLKLRLVRELPKTYIFDELSTEDDVDELIESANVFNR